MMSGSAENKRSMGLGAATSIGVGAMIGAGLFALIGIAVEIAGNLAYLSFLFAGIIALLTSYNVSKLANVYQSKGGPVEYLNKGFGKNTFSGGLNIMMWIGYIIVNSLYARAFGEYGLAVMGLPQDSPWLYALSTGVVLLFITINFLGANVVGKAEFFIVAIKVIVLAGFGVLGLTTMESTKFALGSDFNIQNLVLASGVVFMSYEGFGLVANTAEDIRNPDKNLPIALYASIIIVMVIYLLVTVSVIGNLSISGIIEAKEYALAEAAKPIMGQLGFTVMGAAALFSTASAINATIYGPVNMIQETAKAGQIHQVFVKPVWGHESGLSLLATGGLVILFANTLDMEAIAETGSLIFLIIYSAVNVSNLKLRNKTGSKPWIIWMGIIGTSFSFIVLAYLQTTKEGISLYLLMGIIALGVLYQFYQQRAKT